MDTSLPTLKTLLDELAHAADSRTGARLAEEALGHVQRDADPVLWASLQGALGASLVGAAGGRFTEELFTKVLAAYEAALTVYTPDETPEIWGQTWRNIGATHMGAVQSGLGDLQTMVETAIRAYQKALEVPYERHTRDIWRSAQRELGWALSAAAAWRGPSAHIESALAYASLLEHVSRETEPDTWAMLKLLYASALNESGNNDVAEDAIRASEDALLVLRIETHPLDWAEANLVRGGLYRTRRVGQRDENLERAIESLDGALRVYTYAKTPRQWLRVHYQRGPAYTFRIHGDRRTNLERALESLKIAIAATSQERFPDTWASLQVTLGQVYVERVEGDHQENLESAISTLESAIAVLSPAPVLSWTLGNRLVGLAYLQRQRGDRQDNIERAIAALNGAVDNLNHPTICGHGTPRRQIWPRSIARGKPAIARTTANAPSPRTKPRCQCLPTIGPTRPTGWTR